MLRLIRGTRTASPQVGLDTVYDLKTNAARDAGSRPRTSPEERDHFEKYVMQLLRTGKQLPPPKFDSQTYDYYYQHAVADDINVNDFSDLRWPTNWLQALCLLNQPEAFELLGPTEVYQQRTEGEHREVTPKDEGSHEPSPSHKLPRGKVVAMCNGFFEGFSSPEFQSSLRKLANTKHTVEYAPYSANREKLILGVLAQILPMYGFPGTATGAEEAYATCKQWASDSEVLWLSCAISKQISLAEEVAYRGSLASGLEKVRSVPSRRQQWDGRRPKKTEPRVFKVSGNVVEQLLLPPRGCVTFDTTCRTRGRAPNIEHSARQNRQVKSSQVLAKPSRTFEEGPKAYSEMLTKDATVRMMHKILCACQDYNFQRTIRERMPCKDLILQKQISILSEFGFLDTCADHALLPVGKKEKQGFIEMVCASCQFVEDPEVADLINGIGDACGRDAAAIARHKKSLTTLKRLMMGSVGGEEYGSAEDAADPPEALEKETALEVAYAKEDFSTCKLSPTSTFSRQTTACSDYEGDPFSRQTTPCDEYDHAWLDDVEE